MTEYLIYVKHRKEWESIRRSWAAKDLRWASHNTLTGWDPYNRYDYCIAEGKINKDDPIWLFIENDQIVTFAREIPAWSRLDAIRWKDYCIERRKQNDLPTKHHHTEQM